MDFMKRRMASDEQLAQLHPVAQGEGYSVAIMGINLWLRWRIWVGRREKSRERKKERQVAKSEVERKTVRERE